MKCSLLRILMVLACASATRVMAQGPIPSPLAPICPSGASPRLVETEHPVVLRPATAWNRHEYTPEERTRILSHAQAIGRYFKQPASLGNVPVIAEMFTTTWGMAPSLHSTVGGKLVLVMKPDGHVRAAFWQLTPFSNTLAEAVLRAVSAADSADAFVGIERATSGRGNDTLAVQMRSITSGPERDEVTLMRAKLARYAADGPASVITQGELTYKNDGSLSPAGSFGEMLALVGSDGRAVLSSSQVSRAESRDFVTPMQGDLATTTYNPARSRGCAVPSFFVHGYNFTPTPR